MLTLPMSFRAESPVISCVLGPPRARETKSGAIAMKPSAATWSATPRTHVCRPKISCTTTTTGAFPRVCGYTTQAISESFDPCSHAIFTHSPWRGLALRRAAAVLSLGGSPGMPCSPELRADEVGAAGRRSAALMCIICSSATAAEGCQRCNEQAEANNTVREMKRRDMSSPSEVWWVRVTYAGLQFVARGRLAHCRCARS